MPETSLTLRRLLSEKFPGMQIGLCSSLSGRAKDFWPVNFKSPHSAVPIQLAKGALTEIICEGEHSGSAGLIRTLIFLAAKEKYIIGMIDGMNSLDVVSLGLQEQSRLLWVRCRSASEALKSADLLLRDNNFSLVLLDLKLNPESELRKIPALTWYRLQRLIENTSIICAVFTPRLMVSATRQRVNLSAGGNPFFRQ